MLCLSRKTRTKDQDQVIISFGGQIVTVTVIEVKAGPIGNCVRLGFEAPKEVEIHRREVWDRIQADKKAKE